MIDGYPPGVLCVHAQTASFSYRLGDSCFLHFFPSNVRDDVAGKAEIVETGIDKHQWVLIKKAADLLGYTEVAIRTKIKREIWVRGRHWVKGPDNRLFVNLHAVQQWVVGR